MRANIVQPKFRGYSLETNQWHYGHGWFITDYTQEYKSEKGIIDASILYTDGSPIECVLSSMGRYVMSVKFADQKVELYEGDIVQDITSNDKLYKIVWDDYGIFLFVPLFETDMGAIDYYKLEEMHGDNIYPIDNEFEISNRK
ncbi:hypothetical protein [Psychrobacillus phage Perkons]|nr:hypothetical protein [Psychrobacillus phage Perkons]